MINSETTAARVSLQLDHEVTQFDKQIEELQRKRKLAIADFQLRCKHYTIAASRDSDCDNIRLCCICGISEFGTSLPTSWELLKVGSDFSGLLPHSMPPAPFAVKYEWLRDRRRGLSLTSHTKSQIRRGDTTLRGEIYRVLGVEDPEAKP